MTGKVAAYDRRTWWGKATYGREKIVEFHGTCVRGMTTSFAPRVGDDCVLIFNDDHKLLSVEFPS